MRTLYYVEADGGVFTAKKDGKIVFPESLDKIPFAIGIEHEFKLDENTIVYFCTPKEFTYRSDWPIKNDLICEDNVDKTVRQAIARTIPRLYAAAIVPNELGEIVLVHNCRGFAKDLWTLPGGFVQYSKTPEETARRETKEESGLEVEVDKSVSNGILYVHARCCGKSGNHSLGFACLCKKTGGTLQPNFCDTDKAEYCKINSLPEEINKFTRFAVQRYIEEIN